MAKLLLLILMPVCSFGQFSGRILDSVSRQPIPFATIRLYNQQQLLMLTTFSDSSGRISPTDTFVHFIDVTATGYQPARFTVKQTDFLLHPITSTLSNVTVVAQRPIITTRADGFVYDATQDILTAGESTSDLIRKLPGVQVDPNGVPSMRGSIRIKVFIDGRPSEAYASTIADALRMIPAEKILRIDVITQPSARYEGEGVDGVLQIYTKRPPLDGSSGNINGYYQNRARQLIGSIAVRRRQWIVTGDAGYYYQNNINWTTLTRQSASGQVTQDIVRSNQGYNINSGIGITWLPDSLTTISVGYRPGKGWDHIYTDIDYVFTGNSFNRYIDNPYHRSIHPISWNYIRKSKNKKGEFSLLGNWFNQHIESDYDLYQANYKEVNFNTTFNKELNLESNYTYGGLEAGLKSAFRRYRSLSVFVPDNGNRSQDFFFPRDIYAGYISQTITWNKYKIRVGLRYEHTVLSLDFPDTSIHVPDYKNLLPNLLVSRTYDAHTITAAYSRKIFRPYLSSLSPVINYIDSLNISYGNPYLDPAVSNNYELTYSFLKKQWLISANFFWYQTLRSIEGVAVLQPNGIVARTFQNISQNSTTGFSIQLSYRLPAFNININNNLRYIDFGIRSGWVNNFTANATYKFTSDFSASAYILLNGTRIDVQGLTTGTRYYNFAANKTFMNGKYGLSIRLDNLFMPYQTITEVNKTDDFIITTETKQIRRFFRFGFSYKFGKKEIRVPPVRNVSSEN